MGLLIVSEWANRTSVRASGVVARIVSARGKKVWWFARSKMCLLSAHFLQQWNMWMGGDGGKDVVHTVSGRTISMVVLSSYR